MKTCPVAYQPATKADREEFILHLKQCEYSEFNSLHENNPFICTNKGWAYGNDYDADFSKYYYCGKNLHLAKALLALDDKTDYMQWFTDGGLVELCKFNDFEESIFRCWHSSNLWHKMSKEELIEKFQ